LAIFSQSAACFRNSAGVFIIILQIKYLNWGRAYLVPSLGCAADLDACR